LDKKTTELINFFTEKSNKKGVIKKIALDLVLIPISNQGKEIESLRKDVVALAHENRDQRENDQRELDEYKETVAVQRAAIDRAKGKIAGLEQIPTNAEIKKWRTKCHKLENRLNHRFENTPAFKKLMEMGLEMYEQIVGPILVPAKDISNDPELHGTNLDPKDDQDEN